MFLGIIPLLGVSLIGLHAGPIDLPIAINVCTLPKVTGLCKAYFPKWYYNSQKQKCELFIYGGCGGNANRFDTEIACRLKCADTCTLPNHVGLLQCLAYIPRWWYNYISQQCEPFIYGGCAGTSNNFPTEEACYKRCDKTGCDYVDCSKYPCPHGYKETRKGCRHPKCACHCPCFETVKKCKKNKRGKKKCVKKSVKVKCPKGEKCVVEVAPCLIPPCPYVGKCKPKASVPPPPPTCQQKPDSGCGTKKRKRWYFDTFFLKGCTKFFYTGVGGNDNNFQTEAECKSFCP